MTIIGTTERVKGKPLAFLCVDREWRDGDVVMLKLPMRLGVRTWEKNKNCMSVDYGPLSFAPGIKERWAKYGDRNANLPEWEVLPESPWNYGLVLDARNPIKSFHVERRPGALSAQPFTPETVPISLKAKAQKIPAWQMDRLNLVGPLQQSPAKSTEPVEDLTLIPMGAARLRISSFPTIGSGLDAHEWRAPPKPKPAAFKASASHCFESDTVDALSDGLEPTSSGDHSIPRFTWWPRQDSVEWVQFDFAPSRKVSRVSIYWFDDTGVGSCRVPQSWRLLCKVGNEWQPVSGAGESGVKKDGWNNLQFPAVETAALRIEAQLQPQFSSGILEWKVTE